MSGTESKARTARVALAREADRLEHRVGDLGATLARCEGRLGAAVLTRHGAHVRTAASLPVLERIAGLDAAQGETAEQLAGLLAALGRVLAREPGVAALEDDELRRLLRDHAKLERELELTRSFAHEVRARLETLGGELRERDTERAAPPRRLVPGREAAADDGDPDAPSWLEQARWLAVGAAGALLVAAVLAIALRDRATPAVEQPVPARDRLPPATAPPLAAPPPEAPAPPVEDSDAEDVAAWLARGDAYFDQKRYLFPADGNAVTAYRKVLELEPGNARASSRITAMKRRYVEKSAIAFTAGDLARALTYLERAATIDPTDREVAERARSMAADVRRREAQRAGPPAASPP